MKLWKALLLALSVLLIILTASHMTGCYDPSTNPASRFYVVDKQAQSQFNGHFYEIVDHDTGVHYIFVALGYAGGFTPMYNSDGSIKVEEVKK